MNNENPVLAAVIAATAAIIVGFMNLHSSKKDTGTLSPKEIYNLALNTVWEPLDKIFTLHPTSDPQAKLQQIDIIVSDNYKLIPPEFIKEYRVLKQTDKLKESDFLRIKMISTSYFNWIRKNLGYPFDRTKIKTAFTPKSGRDILLSALGYMALLIITSIVALILLFNLTLLQINDRLSVSDYMFIAVALLGIIATWHITLNQPRK